MASVAITGGADSSPTFSITVTGQSKSLQMISMEPKISQVEQMSTSVDLMVQETTKMAQARQMSTSREMARQETTKVNQPEQRAQRG